MLRHDGLGARPAVAGGDGDEEQKDAEGENDEGQEQGEEEEPAGELASAADADAEEEKGEEWKVMGLAPYGKLDESIAALWQFMARAVMDESSLNEVGALSERANRPLDAIDAYSAPARAARRFRSPPSRAWIGRWRLSPSTTRASFPRSPSPSTLRPVWRWAQPWTASVPQKRKSACRSA